jgi:hypothetical protein
MDNAASMLGSWTPFFSMTGGAAATLTGLMFVVVTLIRRELSADIDREAGISTFSSPTVVHFGAALVVSAILLAPWHDPLALALAVGFSGLVGVVHTSRVIWRARRLTAYSLDGEDWAFYTVLPMLAYCAVFFGACFLPFATQASIFTCAGAVVGLIFIGIRNAWDVVTYLAITMMQRPPTD